MNSANSSKTLNMMGSYGNWLASNVLSDEPARLSFRRTEFKDLKLWHKEAYRRYIECLAPIDTGAIPKVTVESVHHFDGLHIEKLSWQLPYGPRTEAVLLKPEKHNGKLPAILGLHDHAGNKYLGWRKIALSDPKPWSIQKEHHEKYYGGRAWANEMAKRGYVVLVHDAFTFASRRVLTSEVPEVIRNGAYDPEPEDREGVNKYIQFGLQHEGVIEKSILCAGTTYAGIYVREDQVALDILSARPEVDSSRVGCAGLSGGGMRTVYLSAIDERIRCSVPSGFMTTWRDFLLNKSYTHTWMIYIPHLPRDLDFPEILGLHAPKPTLVLNCTEDKLFTISEMKRADHMLQAVYDKCGASKNYKCSFHPGGHKLDIIMQEEQFSWFDQFLKNM